MQEATCPLCGATASLSATAFGERKHYSCRHCKDFVITTTAERLLATKTEERRAYFAALARKGWDDSLLVIERAPMTQSGDPPMLQSRFLSRLDAVNPSGATRSNGRPTPD